MLGVISLLALRSAQIHPELYSFPEVETSKDDR